MKLYTAEYKYAGDDRLDITVKGKDPIGKIFAPTWKMVMGSKDGNISWDEYRQMYRKLMQKSYRENSGVRNDILSRDVVTLVCFCSPGTNCHRYLLAGYMEKLGAEYMGERVSCLTKTGPHTCCDAPMGHFTAALPRIWESGL